jgi:hypothetical protein
MDISIKSKLAKTTCVAGMISKNNGQLLIDSLYKC